jgi:hypothetical protein
MCIRYQNGGRLGEPRPYLSFKAHTHKPYILRYCTNIVYLFPLQHLNTVDTRFVLNANLKKDLTHATP